MAFSVEDKHVIKLFRQTKGYGTKQLLQMFPEKQRTLGGLKALICKIDNTGGIHRKRGSGRQRRARTDGVVDQVEDLVLSQEDPPHIGGSKGGQSGHGPPCVLSMGLAPPPAVTDFTWANYNNIGLLHSLHSATCSRDDRGKIILVNKHIL